MKITWIATVLLLPAIGCGTSKWTDTGRSATEQLLITDAMDRAVSDLNFKALAGKTVFVDSTPLKRISDSEYLVSCMRQHMLANGCILKDVKSDADYIVEARAGAVGTDRHDVLYGVPAVNIPSVVPLAGIPSQVPEMPIIKKTDQRAVVKLSLFAYNQETGRPIWQSGAVPQESDAKAVWVLGAGPFQRGTIFDGMEFAGNKLDIPLVDLYHPTDNTVSVADEAYFPEPEDVVETALAVADEPKGGAKPVADAKKPEPVIPVAHSEPATKPKPVGPSSNPPASPAAAPATSGKPDQAGKTEEPGAAPSVSAQKPPQYGPNDLAPELAKLPVSGKPKLLVRPFPADRAIKMLR